MQLWRWGIMLSLLLGSAYADEVLVSTKDGQTFVFDVDPDESIGMLQQRLFSLTEDEEFIVALPPKHNHWTVYAGKQGSYLGYPRNYLRTVSTQEKSDIRYIVTSLANKSLIAIALIKGDLESAGDRIDHLHPLRFLMTVFTDEELKVGIRNIRGKGWVWNHFVGGLKDCLSAEASIGNMKDEDILDFARTVKLSVDRIYPSIQARNWDHFIEILIKEIPRSGDHDRYDF